MKNPLVEKVSSYLFKAYIAWSIIADIILIGGLIALWLGGIKISL